MGALKNTAQFFLFSLTFGMILFSPIVKSKEFGGGFFRLINTICGVFLFLATAFYVFLFGFENSLPWLGLLGLSSFFTSSLLHKDQRSPAMWIHYFIQVGCLIGILYLFNGPSLWEQIFFFSSSMILGLITFSMTLGHWYLVNPKLSEKPLKITIYILWSLLLFKIIFSAISFVGNKEQLELSNSFVFIIFSMRMLWGYLIIALLSYFTYRLIKMRSIQSATGILYVMTFFVLMGELISNYFYFKYGIYL